MKRFGTKMEDGKKYKCVICGEEKEYGEFSRKSKTGTNPPFCTSCNCNRHADTKEYLSLVGKFGPKMRHASEIKREPTKGEVAMERILRSMGVKFKPQVVILGFIADFNLVGRGVIVEVDGGYHQEAEQRDYDRGRDSIFYDGGCRTVRVTNEEAIENPELCIQKIKECLEKTRLQKIKQFSRNRRRRQVILEGRSMRDVRTASPFMA